MKTAVETLVRQLAAIQDQLIALPDDAFSERFELLRRQEELRAQAAEHAEGADRERPTEDLLVELASLRIQRDAPESERGDATAQAANTGASDLVGRTDAASITRRIDAAHELLRIEGRIGRIKSILIDRGVDPA